MAIRFSLPYLSTLDANGDPVSGSKANFYESGTTTRLDTYSDEGLTTANANPVVADSAGKWGDIWIKEQAYKVIVTDSDDVVLTTMDPVNGSLAVSGDDFKVSPQTPADMTINISAGSLYDLNTKTRVLKAIQTSGAITAPSANPRIDVVYVDQFSGVFGIETGSEAATPAVPTIPNGKLPLAQIALAITTTEITDSEITDIRELANIGASSPISRGHIDGLILSNGTDSDHDIDIADGEARDNADTVNIPLSAITKQIDDTWAAGTDAGGLSSSLTAPAVDTWYHVHAIIVGGSADVGFDTSVTAANLVADHTATAYRRIGSVLTDGSANIVAFTQYGDEFLLSTPVQDFQQSSLGTSANLFALSVPTGLKVWARLSIGLDDDTPTASTACFVTSPDQADTVPTGSLHDIFISIAETSPRKNIHKTIRTDTSAQIRLRIDNSDTAVVARGVTHGWIDPRGRDL